MTHAPDAELDWTLAAVSQCEGSMPLVMPQKDLVIACFGEHHCPGPKDRQDAAWLIFGLQEPKCTCRPPGRYRAGKLHGAAASRTNGML